MNFTKKRLLSFCIGLLLLIIAFSVVFFYFGGGHFGSFGETAVIKLVISFVMMVAPAIVWFINHKHLGRKRGIKTCAVNSLFIFIVVSIWPVVAIINNESCNLSYTICDTRFSWEILIVVAILAILYFLINVCFWVDLRKTK